MVSKTRVFLIMLLLLVVAIGMIVLLVKLDAGAFWIRTVPLAVLGFGAVFAQSMGWFRKKVEETG
ncbi:hypothetical protein AMES_2796 [Amycolatopsis mediterranei S699]|uniref:Integral membrane protein n=2 Tax=Amycolatopsis mediterranei TaxID=33910 RepID=A0A0H3D114_AMYMU|nr:hypothetical protein [Amycolatopsis mediterranei]ADJ44619.1 hypothetical protein AMED_2825 [Amycolatopsis mediterranei U32]AEK41359.1 hypothetical protein RAM_14355 [Amycolatopsis mediterranei S699]AFO76332.1 hypothetical protein AMES_2796 [Amycolatopsis mediterranei S699]AGT83461.1 hypothetical protein B737_2797 [Amycolatopsis mediterranei RB]KDO07023.1 hypothetical protein DV26_30185 [Amycolatopsis mediterranei]